jgi:hypothetical protein
MTYNDPLFVRYAYADQGAPPSTFGQYISGNNTAPANTSWMTATMQFDVTEPTGALRYAVGEGEQTSQTLIAEVSTFLNSNMGNDATFPNPDPDTMDNQQLGQNGNPNGQTMQNAWTPW